MTYARFEDQGTLPNLMSGEATVSRETSDAPLWFGLACEETARHVGASLYDQRPHPHRSLLEVLASIASSLIAGAPNGVCVDHETGLVFSPPHYTWMDTNYPAATPREGYPIELSVLFIRLLTQLSRFGVRLHGEPAEDWAERARASMTLFYRPELGYCADTLHAPRGVSARRARPDDHLRPNQLLAVSLGIFEGEQARSIVRAAGRCLLVPGALRTLAPLPVAHALPVRDAEGRLLNDPQNPYKGRYEGDEDSQRKPAYHNGTAWVWWLPTYCEALVHAYEDDESAVLAARAILGSTARLMEEGCIGQLPEIIDGDAPHAQRGCDAQAWSVTETLRLWLALSGK
jgi:predicted glycogen debranching enzyme